MFLLRVLFVQIHTMCEFTPGPRVEDGSYLDKKSGQIYKNHLVIKKKKSCMHLSTTVTIRVNLSAVSAKIPMKLFNNLTSDTHWPVSRRCWRCCGHSPGRTAGSSGPAPRSHTGRRTSRCGSSRHNIATVTWRISQNMTFSWSTYCFFFFSLTCFSVEL